MVLVIFFCLFLSGSFQMGACSSLFVRSCDLPTEEVHRICTWGQSPRKVGELGEISDSRGSILGILDHRVVDRSRILIKFIPEGVSFGCSSVNQSYLDILKEHVVGPLVQRINREFADDYSKRSCCEFIFIGEGIGGACALLVANIFDRLLWPDTTSSFSTNQIKVFSFNGFDVPISLFRGDDHASLMFSSLPNNKIGVGNILDFSQNFWLQQTRQCLGHGASIHLLWTEGYNIKTAMDYFRESVESRDMDPQEAGKVPFISIQRGLGKIFFDHKMLTGAGVVAAAVAIPLVVANSIPAAAAAGSVATVAGAVEVVSRLTYCLRQTGSDGSTGGVLQG